MEQVLFSDLKQSLKEAQPSRRFTVVPPDVKAVREQIGLSQSRNSTGPAVALLKIVVTAPEVALKTLHS